MISRAWYDAVLWLLFTAVGFLLPVVGGILVPLAFGAAATMEGIAGAGQFAISSAGLLMTTSYFVARPNSLTRLPLTEWFSLVSVIGLVIGAILFVLATLHTNGVDVKADFYVVPSIVLFAIALIVAFVAVGLDKMRDVKKSTFLDEQRQSEFDKTERGFEDTFNGSVAL